MKNEGFGATLMPAMDIFYNFDGGVTFSSFWNLDSGTCSSKNPNIIGN